MARKQINLQQMIYGKKPQAADPAIGTWEETNDAGNLTASGSVGGSFTGGMSPEDMARMMGMGAANNLQTGLAPGTYGGASPAGGGGASLGGGGAGRGGGGGGGGGSGMRSSGGQSATFTGKGGQYAKNIQKDYESQRDAANAANLSRYDEMMGGIAKTQAQVGGRFDQAQGLLANSGQAARARIQRSTTQAKGSAEQGLISRGLGNTTVRNSVLRGIDYDAEAANQAVDERVAGQQSGLIERRAGAEMSLGRSETAAIAGRTDAAPDMSLYMSMLQNLSNRGI